MRYAMTACVLMLAALLGHAQVADDKKDDKKDEPAPPWARVVIGGEIRDLLELRSKIDVLALLDRDIPMATLPTQWRGPLPPRKLETKGTAHVRSIQVSDSAWVVTLLEPADKDLDKELPKLKAPEMGGLRVYVTLGILAASPDKDPFVAHANAWGMMRVYDKVKDSGTSVPTMGHIIVMGQALPGKYELSKGKFTSLAIQNGSSPILITGKVNLTNGPERGQEPKGMVHVTGKLIVSKQGPLVVEANSIKPMRDEQP
jgi:hypothetical protein